MKLINQIKVLKVKEHKDGSATLTLDITKDVEAIVKKYYNKKRFSKALMKRFVIEGLTNYFKRSKDESK